MPRMAKTFEDLSSWDQSEYTKSQLTQKLDSELVDEYMKLRKTVLQRERRLKEAGFEDSKAYRMNTPDNYPTVLGGNLGREDVIALIQKAKGFLESDMSTVQGQKLAVEKAVSSLHKKGYTFVNSRNLKEFGQFMDYMRSRFEGELLSSERLVQIFDMSEQLSVDPMKVAASFESWRDVVATSIAYSEVSREFSDVSRSGYTARDEGVDLRGEIKSARNKVRTGKKEKTQVERELQMDLRNRGFGARTDIDFQRFLYASSREESKAFRESKKKSAADYYASKKFKKRGK